MHLRDPGPVRILVADDHEAVRKGVCAILSSRLDIEVCGEASNGQEAIEKAQALKPHLIILDITMPVLNGIDAARVIRQTLPELPILLLSMHDGKRIIEDAKRIGIEGYVSKSQASATLLAAVDAILRNQTFFPKDT
jgi:two-component system nitrate/nitrite response regulator NarL